MLVGGSVIFVEKMGLKAPEETHFLGERSKKNRENIFLFYF